MNWKYRTNFTEGLKLNAEWEIQASERLKYVVVPSKNRKVSAIIACYKDNQSIPILHERL